MSFGYGRLAARVYQLDKPPGHSFGDVEFYLRRLAGTSDRILEAGVGTGRLLVPLLEAGLDVEGVDSSPEMLAICRENCRSRGFDPVLREGDLAGPSTPAGDEAGCEASYAAVVIPSGTIALLDGRPAVERALDRIRYSLRPGGLLLLDLLPPAPGDERAPMRWWPDGDELLTLTVQSVEHDPAGQRTVQWLRYERWRDGALLDTELQRFALCWYERGEFAGLLAAAGFDTVRVHADYREGAPPGRADRMWTFEAR